MSNLVLNMAIDTSGQPYDTIYVGLITIKTDQLNKFEKEFRGKFPKFYRYKEKGAKRSASELKSIISFMNEKSFIKMYTISLNNKEWVDLKSDYKGVSYFIEKAYSLIYSYLFTRVCWKYKPYNAIICEESYLDINRVIEYCNFLNKSLNRNIVLSKGNASINFLIRMADFVASSHRKVDKDYLEKLERYQIYRLKDINYSLVNKIFKK